MATGVGPVKQAFVRALRDITALKAAIGSDGINEGFALDGAQFPFVVYSVMASSLLRTFGDDATRITTIDCWVSSSNQVEAHNLDRLIYDGLEDIALDFSETVVGPESEPSTLLCRRLRDMSLVELDESGNKVYQVGGTYQIWTDRL